MPCDMTDMLHIAAIDIGTIRADHYQMDFFTIPIAVKMPDIITEPMNIKIIIGYGLFLLPAYLLRNSATVAQGSSSM